MQTMQGTNGNGTVKIPLSEVSHVHPPPGETLLPRGRVEVVMLVDPKLWTRGPDGKIQKVRISFDYERFSRDENGQRLPERKWKPYVAHVIHLLRQIMEALATWGLEPVYAGKQDDDLIEVGLWNHPRNPPVVIEILGQRATRFVIDHGNQCLKGFDPKLDVITDLGMFPL